MENKVKEYYSDISYEVIDPMIVLSGSAMGSEPETKIMELMKDLANIYRLNVLRTFGFDIPFVRSDNVAKLRGYECWLAVDMAEIRKLPSEYTFEFEGVNVFIKKIPSCRYAKLRIEDPFSDPYERIGGGWRRLLRWMEKHDFKASGIVKCDNAYCLEEISEVNELIVMDIYVPVARVNVNQ